MVKIAIAGGSSKVAQQIIDALIETEKHDILLLSRKDVTTAETRRGVSWAKANYENPRELAKTLRGIHTVLSFIVVHMDEGNLSQKSLIDAAVQAGVKRIAPSEWSLSSCDHMRWYKNKVGIREYLKELNKDKKVLEYTLFQPGFFLNYFTFPYKSAKHIDLVEFSIDFNNRRAMRSDNDDGRFTLTTVQDLANIVARAVEYDGEWPVVGGIKGTELSLGELIAIGEKIRDGSFAIDTLRTKDLETGTVKASWMPSALPPAFPPEQNAAISKMLFTQAAEFLTNAWIGKP